MCMYIYICLFMYIYIWNMILFSKINCCLGFPLPPPPLVAWRYSD